jgi:hypothetical protein
MTKISSLVSDSILVHIRFGSEHRPRVYHIVLREMRIMRRPNIPAIVRVGNETVDEPIPNRLKIMPPFYQCTSWISY